MRLYTLHPYVAATYGQGAYGGCTYDATGSCATATQTSTGGSTASTSSGGTLANTGLSVAIITTLACLIIFVALLVRFWHRAPESVTIDDMIEEHRDEHEDSTPQAPMI
jgi:hypothetical protein